MEFIELKENVSVILARTNVGVINKDSLIDTGIDQETGRKIRKLLDDQNISIKKIYNTHSHIDHIGGDEYFYKKGCKIYIPEKEDVFLKYPEMTNYFLNYPEQRLSIKNPIQANTEIDIRYIPLPGHSFNQFGYIVDNVFFCGDAFVSEYFIEKHKVLFHNDPLKEKETLYNLLEMKFEYWIPSHSEEILKNPKNIIKKNIRNIQETESTITEICNKKTEEEITNHVLSYFGISATKNQYFVYKKVIQNYLFSLYNAKKLDYTVEANKLVWYKII